MPFHASDDELRLALLSVFSAGPLNLTPGDCANAVDAAIAAAFEANREDLRITAGQLTSVRFGAARVLNSLCAACRACPRGRLGAARVWPPDASDDAITKARAVKLQPPRRPAA